MRKYNESCCVNMSRNSQELPEQQKLTKLCSNVGFSKNIDKGHIFITPDEEGHDDMKISRREHTKPWNEGTPRVRGWRSAVIKDVTVLRSWSNLYSRPNSERNQQIRDRNVRRNSCCKRWEQRYRKTCREGWTTTNADLNVVSCVYSLSWTKMDRCWSRKIPVKVVLMCQNSWSDCYDMMMQFIEKMMEL